MTQGLWYRPLKVATTFSKGKQPKGSHTRRSFVGFLLTGVHRASSRVPSRERGRGTREEPGAL